MQFSDFGLKHASLEETENKQADRKKNLIKLIALDVYFKQNPNMVQNKQA